MTQVLRGNIIHAPKMGELSILEHGFLVLEDGVIQAVCPSPVSYTHLPHRHLPHGGQLGEYDPRG